MNARQKPRQCDKNAQAVDKDVEDHLQKNDIFILRP